MQTKYFLRKGGAVLIALVLFSATIVNSSQLIISEFMASNSRNLADEDGSFEDWIEIHNRGTNAVNLEGWYLTDSRSNLKKWQFPSTNLNAGAYLVVFASGKDRRIPGARLHTNFRLNGSGEYLALVEPDGVTIATEFSPVFPPQFADVSFGFAQASDVQKVVNSNSQARLLIPSNGALGLLWTEILFDDSTWVSGTNCIGFDIGARQSGQTDAEIKNYYPFENNAVDRVGSYSGSLNGSPTFSSGKSGQAINLNGTSQYISFLNLNYPSKFSISLWVKPVMKGNIMTIAANSAGGFQTAGFRFFINQYQTTNGLINFETGDGVAGAITRSLYPVNWDVWNNVIVIVDRSAGRGKIYLNGVDVTDPNANTVSTGFPTTGAWEIGRMSTSGFYLQGQIDDYAIWQGELSQTQIAALLAGASPTNLLVFKQYIKTDIQNLMLSNNATAYIRFPFTISDPSAIQTLKLKMRYNDGFVAYLNGVEIVRKNAPEIGFIADSTIEFSGIQGKDNWYYGYYNLTLDPDQTYQPQDFIPFPSSAGAFGPSNYWTGSLWDWYAGNPPWTELNSQGGHPNGINYTNIHFAIRRWVSEAPGTLKISLRLAKSNPNCGNGTTGRIFHNGIEKFSKTISYNDSTGISTNVIIYDVKAGDFIDFAIDPTGTDGQPTDPCDGTIFTASIEHIAPPELTWNSSALTTRSDLQSIQFEEFDLYGMRRNLVPGLNILAIHGLNASPTNGNFYIEAELETSTATGIQENLTRYFAIPTPGAPNGAGVADLGPIITEVSHTPEEPDDSQDILITARITPAFAPIVSNTLYYRVMFGSEYPVQMRDDGNGGDIVPNDGVYSAIIPASASSPGQMVRWYIVSTDASNRVSRFPILTDTNRCPIYLGTVIKNPALTNPLPVFHWFIQNPAAADTDAGTRCSVYYGGIFYDNVYVNIHGQSSRGFPKKSYDIEFNPGYRFRYDPNKEPVGDINFMTTYPDKAHMRNILSYETYRDAGSAYHWVIPARVQQNGAFWGDVHLMENGDADFLERLGLDPNNPLYKMYNTFTSSPSHATIAGGNAEKKTRKWEGNADLLALLNGVIQSDISNRTLFLYDNVDIPQMINMLAARIITGDQDCCHKNYYLYRDTTGTGEWQAFPWDVDLSFGRRWISGLTYWDDTIVINTRMPVGDNNGLFNALYQTPQIAEMYWRRLRTLMDEILQPPGTPTNQLKFEKRIDELTAIIAPDAALDLAKWGTWGNGSASSICCIQTQPQAADIIKYTYLPQRRIYLFSNMVVTAGGRIPLAQPPDVKIGFGKIEFNPASGRQSEEYIQLTNFNSIAVDISNWRLEGGVRHIFKPGTVIPAYGVLYVSPDVNAFRARQTPPRGGMGLFVQGNYQGQLSARGEAILLLDKNGNFVNIGSYTPGPSLAQQYLRITELMYNPAPVNGSGFDAQEFEYIELKNIGPVAISLVGVRLTNGVYFDFSTSQIQTLAAGQNVLVVKNLNAFLLKYGNLTNIAGVYTGSLDNNGERITLIDSNGEEILDFNYNNNWYPITDGLGFSLVIKDESAEPDAWDKKSNWRIGSISGGTPGANEPPQSDIPPVLINEILARSDTPPPYDTIELYNPNNFPVDISGWFLTDDFRTPKKYRIPDGTIIPPYSYWIVDEQEFNKTPGVFPSFALAADGDEVYLFSADTNGNLTGFYHGYEFGASENGVTFGTFTTSDGITHFVPQSYATLGTNNAPPLVGKVVISEIMYNPPARSTNDPPLSFVELMNTSSNVEQLFLTTTNVWKLTGGIEFSFPTNISLAANEKILVVAFDPQTDTSALYKFRSIYGISTNVRIFGAFSKKLNNTEDIIQLKKPVLDKSGNVMEVLTDEVHYKDSPPWDAGADGTGLSLQRLNLNGFGNEPTNWVSAKPTPGDGLSNWNPPDIITHPQSQIVILGSNITLRVQADGTPPLTYQWRYEGKIIQDATNSILEITNAQLYNSGVYQVSVINEYGSASSAEAKITVVIPAAILSQPQDVAVFPNQPAVFGIAASSISSISYQWLKNGVPIPGATNAVFTIPSALPSDAGEYSVLVSDATATIQSRAARLTVWTHPLFIVQPTTTNINPGASATFTALATSSTPVRYQWRHNGVDIPGATSNSITISNAQLEQSGVYTVVATDDYGSLESNPANLNVLVKPSIIKQPTPSNYVAYVGEDVNFEVGAFGLLPISYRWRQNALTITNITINSTNCIFTITNVQFTNAGYYDVAITNAAGAAPGLTTRAYLTVLTPMTNVIVRPGSNAVFTLTAKVTSSSTVPANMALKYQWWFNKTNLLVASGTNYLIITNATIENEGAYTVIATNSVGTIITQTAFLIIREKPVIVRHPVSQTVSIGETATFSVIAEDAEPLQYRWFFNDSEIAGETLPVLTISNVQSSAAGRYYVVVYNNAGSVTSDVATLTISSGGDTDNDGMLDEWEIANGLNPYVNDANEDADNDGMSNFAEFIAGTNPNDPNSKLKISPVILDDGAIKIEWETVAGKQYIIEFKTNLHSEFWIPITNITATSTNKLYIIDRPNNNQNRKFYRIGVAF